MCVCVTEFSRDAVPADLDVIVIGSGLGGLTAAALLAKLGKRVLVLEQMDQAGGLCRSFNEKGFDFDMGMCALPFFLSPCELEFAIVLT